MINFHVFFFIFLLKGFYYNGFIGNVLIYLTENKWQHLTCL